MVIIARELVRFCFVMFGVGVMSHHYFRADMVVGYHNCHHRENISVQYSGNGDGNNC